MSGSWVLAQRANWSRMGDQLSGDAARLGVGDIVPIVVACLVAAGLIWLLHWAARRQEVGGTPSHGRLFNELCRAHGLGGKDRRLVRRLAVESGLEHPGEVFLRSDLFEPAGRPASLDGAAEELAGLARLLFAEDPDSAETSDEPRSTAGDVGQDSRTSAEQPAAVS